MKLHSTFFLATTIMVFWVSPGEPQMLDRPPSPLTLDLAIQFALDHYPSVRASLARVSAEQAGVDLTRTAFLPRVSMGYQGNMGTFNKASGLFFFAPYTPPIWGRQAPTTSYQGAWGSAAGVYAGWEPFDLGLRNANVEAARAAERQAAAGVSLTKLDVGLGVGDAFFIVLMAQQTVEAMKANLERRRVFAETVTTLVKSGLRPGADASRAQAELALARTQLIQAQQAEEIAKATLAEVLGVAGTPMEVAAGALLSLPRSNIREESTPESHPLAITQMATVDIFRKRKEALDRAWVPRLEIQSVLFARGSSWDVAGNRIPGYDGLLPDTPNWAVGLALSFELMDFASVRAKRRMEQHHEQAEAATYDQIIQALTGKQSKARATFEATQRVADNTPVQVKAARDAETQALVRYKSGLATVVEAAEAQQLLAQATVDDTLARLGMWRSLLGLSGAQGNLDPFLQLVRITNQH